MLSRYQKKILDYSYNYYEQTHSSDIVYTITNSDEAVHVLNSLPGLLDAGYIRDVNSISIFKYTFTLNNPTIRYME